VNECSGEELIFMFIDKSRRQQLEHGWFGQRSVQMRFSQCVTMSGPVRLPSKAGPVLLPQGSAESRS